MGADAGHAGGDLQDQEGGAAEHDAAHSLQHQADPGRAVLGGRQTDER